MRENKAIWKLINPDEGGEQIYFKDWDDKAFNESLSKFQEMIGQKPSEQLWFNQKLEEDKVILKTKQYGNYINPDEAIWKLINPDEGGEQIYFKDWDDNTDKWILSKFKKWFGQKPSEQYTQSKVGGRGGDLEFSTIYLFIYNCFDTENAQGYEIGKVYKHWRLTYSSFK